jgi:hypothetical protein
MPNPSPDGLIALLKDKSDLAILQEQGWYRVPVDTAPRRWPPAWIGFYQPKNFGPDAYRVRYFGRVGAITQVPRRELFPNELPSILSDRLYHRISFEKLEERELPLYSSQVPQVFYPKGKGPARQPSLFDRGEESYTVEADPSLDLD